MVRPGKELSFDIKNNLIPFIKDRALALAKSEAVDAYIHKGTVPWRKKKVIIRFLTLRDSGSELLEYMDLFVRSIDTIENSLTCKLTRKECELKKEGRWFGQTTFYRRLQLQTVEYNTKRYLKKFIPNQPMSNKPEFSKLLVDIYSLPLRTPPRAFGLIKQFISRQLPYIVKDRDLKEIIKMTTQRKKREFVRSLMDCNPCYIKILSAAYSASPFALRDDCVAIFESTSTILEFLSLGRGAENAHKLIKRAKAQDVKWMAYFRSVGKSYYDTPLTEEELKTSCPTGISTRLRNRSWGVDLIGVTYLIIPR